MIRELIGPSFKLFWRNNLHCTKIFILKSNRYAILLIVNFWLTVEFKEQPSRVKSASTQSSVVTVSFNWHLTKSRHFYLVFPAEMKESLLSVAIGTFWRHMTQKCNSAAYVHPSSNNHRHMQSQILQRQWANWGWNGRLGQIPTSERNLTFKNPVLQKTNTKLNTSGQILNIQNTRIHQNSTKVVCSKLSAEAFGKNYTVQ